MYVCIARIRTDPVKKIVPDFAYRRVKKFKSIQTMYETSQVDPSKLLSSQEKEKEKKYLSKPDFE
jgi:hypothetical protein